MWSQSTGARVADVQLGDALRQLIMDGTTLRAAGDRGAGADIALGVLSAGACDVAARTKP